jgi:hypothetical protein
MPVGIKRVLVAAKIQPETRAIMDAEHERTGKSLGVLIDEAFQRRQIRTHE